MRETILEAEDSDLVEPGFLRAGVVVEDIESMVSQDIILESCYHAEDGQLTKVKDGSSRETSSKKVNDYMGSQWQESLETTEFFFVVLA